MADAITWNFNAADYVKPTELRSGYGTTASTVDTSSILGNTGVNNFSSISNWSSIGMSGLFDGVSSLCSYADAFTTQNAGIIAQAEAYNNQVLNQQLYQAQQVSALRTSLLAQGINPDSVLGTSTTGTTNSNTSALNQLAALFGGNSTTGTTSNSTSALTSLLSLFGLGSTGTTQAATYSYGDDDGGDDAFWEYIDSKVASSRQQSSYNTLLAQLFG